MKTLTINARKITNSLELLLEYLSFNTTIPQNVEDNYIYNFMDDGTFIEYTALFWLEALGCVDYALWDTR